MSDEQNTASEPYPVPVAPWHNPDGEDITREYTITFNANGVIQKRTYVMIPFNNAQRAFMLRLKREYARDQHLESGAPVLISPLIEYTMESAARTRDAIQTGYAGDMTGIDWFTADPELLEVMITNFFIAFWKGLNRTIPS